MIEFRTLGTIDLRDPDNGEGLDAIVSRSKRVALLAYLALGGTRGYQRRDRLFTLFWPEATEDRARKALNQAAYVLRQALGSKVLLSRGDGDLGLDLETIWCDATDFEARLARGETESALTLYHGDLLPAFHLSDCPDFERWLDAERIALRRRALEAARTVAAEYESDGNVVEAAFWLRRAIAWAPYDESVLEELLGLLGRHGDRAGAVREYDAFASRFSEDLGLEPSQEVTDLLDRIRKNGLKVPGEVNGPGSLTHAADRQVGEGHGPTPTQRPPPGPTSRTLPRWSVSAAVIILVSLGIFATRLPGDPDLPSGVQPKRLLVAVFANELDADADASLGMLASDRVAEGLAGSGLVEVVPPAETSRWRRILVDEGHSENDPGILQATAERAGAGLLVTGSYAHLGSSIEFRARVIDVRRGTLLRAVGPIAVDPEVPRTGLQELSDRLQGATGTVVDPRFASWAGTSSLPPDLESYRGYAGGVDLYSAGRLAEAAEVFLAAADSDTGFTAPVVWAALARAVDWYVSEHLDDARLAAAQELVEQLGLRRTELPAWDRAMLAHVEAMLDLDFPGAHGSMRDVVDVAPGTEWLLRLATMAGWLDRPGEVLEVLSRIDPSDEFFERHRRRYWGMTLSSHHRLGQYARELELARSLKTTFAGWSGLHHSELRALAALGRDDDVEEKLRILSEGTPADRLLGLNQELRAHGYEHLARTINLRAMSLVDERPEEQRDDDWKYSRGNMLVGLSRDADARAQLLEISPDSPRYLDAIQVVGEIAARDGDRATALRISEQLEAIRQESLKLLYQAIIAAELGERERAVALLRRSQSPVRGIMHRELLFPNLQGYAPFEELEQPRG